MIPDSKNSCLTLNIISLGEYIVKNPRENSEISLKRNKSGIGGGERIGKDRQRDATPWWVGESIFRGENGGWVRE